jgi:hypothetical protein
MLSIILLAQPRTGTDCRSLRVWPFGLIGAEFDRSQDSPALKERETDQTTDSLHTKEPGPRLPFTLETPWLSEGESVSASALVRELLWQHYGLDLLHPEVSRWLERWAPDVKYARAESQPASSDGRDRFRVGPNGIVKVYLSLEIDDRLRAVSSQYFLSRSRSKFKYFVKAIFGLS